RRYCTDGEWPREGSSGGLEWPVATRAARNKEVPSMATGTASRTSKSQSPKRAAGQRAEVQGSNEGIAKRAFEKFMGRGGVHGFDQQDWFDAQDELIAESREK